MIADFLASWHLFHHTYLAGWSIAALLSLVGVVVVARDQIFIGAAVSQASMLGIALGMQIGRWPMIAGCAWCQSDGFLSLAGGLFAVLGALITGRRANAGRDSHEAVTGWLFLLGSSVSILLVAHSPHGLEEVHRLLSSTIIGATGGDVWTFAAMTACTVAALALWTRPVLLSIMDPEMAGAAGVPVRRLEVGLSIWLGIAVGLSIRVSGMTYTFGCLVLPALVAKNICREVRAMFVAAPIVAVGSAAAAFVLANHYDYPPGQIAVAVQCALLGISWEARRRRRVEA